MPPVRAVLFHVGDFCLFLVDNSSMEQIVGKMKICFVIYLGDCRDGMSCCDSKLMF